MIVASGPSAKNAPLHVAKGKAKFIAINKSWELAPWADILYACDFAWWRHVKGCPGFTGLKLTVDRAAVKDFPELKQVDCRKPDDRLFLSPLGTVGWGGNGGFHALNLAVQFGCRKIILVGYDMTTRYGLHWHGAHPGNLHNPKEASAARWRRAVDNASKVIHPMGIKVINCSKVSALTSYPKMELDEALAS